MTNGVICVLPTSGWYQWPTTPYEPRETLFAEFDSDSMTISEPFTARGFYKPVSGEQVPPDTYLRVLFPDTVQLIRLNR